MTDLVPMYYRGLLRDVTREAYPTLGQMYAELARPTPRPRPAPPRRVASHASRRDTGRGRASVEGEGITLGGRLARFVIGGLAGGVIALPAPAAARLLHSPPIRWHAPSWWLPQALCIHQHEGAWDANTGNGYAGGMQFTLATWNSVASLGWGDGDGAHRAARVLGDIARASPREQLYRAWLVWARDGHSWREWGTARACGLR